MTKDKVVSVRLPKILIHEIDSLIEMGEFVDQSDFIRTAIRNEITRKNPKRIIKVKGEKRNAYEVKDVLLKQGIQEQEEK